MWPGSSLTFVLGCYCCIFAPHCGGGAKEGWKETHFMSLKKARLRGQLIRESEGRGGFWSLPRRFFGKLFEGNF